MKILDCTFRDGGYYNNWNFNNKIIQEYFYQMDKLNIKYIELGFRFIDKNKIKGPTAYTTENFIKKFYIPKNLFIGVMINASDFFFNKTFLLKNVKKLFPNIETSKIKFVRIACHYNEIFFLKECIDWFNSKKISVFINIMQISEFKKNNIKLVSDYFNSKKIRALYLADSLGSLNPKSLTKIIKLFKKHYHHDLGFHAHNNLGLAKKNALTANKLGVDWIDSTVMGMGRGAGNLVTEEIIKNINKFKSKKFIIKKIINNYFVSLKKKYNWGTNKYYKIGAKYKIHPTYIQNILTDSRYKKTDYLKIIDSFKKTESKKFDPYKIYQCYFFKAKNFSTNLIPSNILKGRDILIIGPGDSVLKLKNKIENFIVKNKLFVLGLNTVSSIANIFFDLRIACHPLRIISDISFYNQDKTKLVMPYTSIKKFLKKNKIFNSKKYYDYGLKLGHGKKVFIKDNYCILPYPLAIAYALSIAIQGKVNKIYVAGLDGYKPDNSSKDNTDEILKIFKYSYFNRKITSLTPTNYKSLFKKIIL
jgi:4-hydroxy 2-oxovalerate aldolase